MAKKIVTDLDVAGKKVLVRADFNVPMKDGKITNDENYELYNKAFEKVYGHSAFDDNDNFVSVLVQGSSNNPQDFTFTSDTNHIRFGCFDPDNALTYYTVKAV